MRPVALVLATALAVGACQPAPSGSASAPSAPPPPAACISAPTPAAAGHAAGLVPIRYDTADTLPQWLQHGRITRADGGGELQRDQTRVQRNPAAGTAEGWVRLRYTESQVFVDETPTEVRRVRYQVEEVKFVYCCPTGQFVMAERRFVDGAGVPVLTLPYGLAQDWRPSSPGSTSAAVVDPICRGGRPVG